MQNHAVTLRDGTLTELFQASSGLWACPVCGSFELTAAPYLESGGSSFEMCSCGFEFGFDDDPGASDSAVNSVQHNWERWRVRFLSRLRHQPQALAEAVERLRAIGIKIGSENTGDKQGIVD